MKLLRVCASACFLLFLLFCSGSGAEEVWTLRKSVDYAIHNNPDLQAAESRITMSRYQLDFQKSTFLPHLDFNSGTGWLIGAPVGPWAVVRGVTEEGLRSKNVSGGYIIGALDLNIPILKEGVFFAQNAPSINIAAQQVSIDKNTYETKKNEIIYGVSASFLSLLKNEEDIKVAQDHVKALKASHNLILSKFKEGLVSRNELLTAEARLSEGEKDLQTYRNMSFLLATELCTKMGLERPKAIAASDEGFVPPVLTPMENYINDALTNRAEIAAQELRVSQAREELRRTERERYPNLEITSNAGVGNDYGTHTNPMWIAGIRTSVPLFDFGGISAKIKSRQAKVAEEEKLLVSLRGNISQEVVTAYTSISNAKVDIVSKEKATEQAMENAKLTRARFEQNLVPLSSVLAADYLLYASQKALAEAKYNLRAGYLSLVKAIDYRTFLY